MLKLLLTMKKKIYARTLYCKRVSFGSVIVFNTDENI